MLERMTFRSARGSAMALILAGTFALAGCDEQIMLTDAAVDPSDSCSPYRGTIAAARQTEIQQQAQSAAAGAVFGAILGAVVADATGGDPGRGALIGAAAGGLTGLSSAYYQQQAARANDQASLLALVNADAGREVTLVSQTGAASLALRQCRRGQVASLSQRLQSGQVSTDAARLELATIQANLEEDNEVISAAFNGIGERVDAYIDATAAASQLDRQIIIADSVAAAPPAASPTRAATPSVRTVAKARRDAVTADDAARVALDREVEAINVALG